MPFLNHNERRSLAAVCDTLAPSLKPDASDSAELFALSAADLDLSERLERALETVTTSGQQRGLRLFLNLLRFPLVNGLLAKRWGAFDQMDLESRTQVLRSWAESRFSLRRQAFQGLKRLAMFLFYTAMPDGAANPTWPEIGYPGPPQDRTKPSASLRPLVIERDTRLSADVVIVGSGAGGGVVAAELAAAGKDVIVLEKGGHFEEADFHGAELDGNVELFENAGALTTADVSMVVLAGSVLGGGTVVNWSTSLPLPESVRWAWQHEHGFDGADSLEYAASEDAVMRRLNVNTNESQANAHNAVLERGAGAIGHPVEVIPRNVKGCVACDYCGFGCRFGAKQSALTTYLADAQRRGARIVVGAHVDRVNHPQGQATGIEATVHGHNGRLKLAVRARAVVVAAGSIHTPALLMRSGLTNPNIGQHLYLHPTTAPFAVFDSPVCTWSGPPQTRIVESLSDLDGRDYGVRFEVAPAHPGLWAFALPWSSGRQHRRLMQRVDHLANIIIITRDRFSGRVELDSRGGPVMHYRLSANDAGHMMQGLVEAIKMLRAAGAREIWPPFQPPMTYRRSGDDFGLFLEDVRRRALHPNTFGLYSAHQMGSCRIAGDPRRGALMPSGESYEVKNLFVADGSVFPSSCGVNPMIPIMSTAHFLAQRMKAQL